MTLNPTEIPGTLAKFLAHFFDMHGWQKTLFTLSVILFGTGTAGKMATYFNQPQVASTPAAQTPPPAPEPTMSEKLSPWAIRMGGSVLLGFIIGMAMRIFIKITAIVLAVGIGIMVLLSHYNIVSFDLASEKAKYESKIHEAQDEATKLKDTALSYIPSSGGGALGVFAGFRRKRLPVSYVR